MWQEKISKKSRTLVDLTLFASQQSFLRSCVCGVVIWALVYSPPLSVAARSLAEGCDAQRPLKQTIHGDSTPRFGQTAIIRDVQSLFSYGLSPFVISHLCNSNGRDNGIVDWWMGRLCWSSDKETTGLVVLQRLLSHAKCHLPYLKATGLLVIGGESLRPRHFTMLLVLLVLWQVLVACGQRCGVVSVMCLWSGFHLEGCLPKSAN